MSDNRWQRVEEIFHRAVDLAPQARSAFLDQACGADESLRREVESLLAHESEDGATFAGAPTTIAHYRILGKLGEGGMGAVYRAIDTKLGREVAIKVLPRSFADDPDRMARFAREAKVLASLNHPSIAQIYGLEEGALILELVPGETLKGPLPVKTALTYAKQIAEALETAHEKGIVHRDLKPGNIVVTSDGVVKLLDFGLAAVALPAGDPLKSPTITMQTTPGTIMGTAAYMSPEQASGKPVDRRADIWSFGVVLYEMLTGDRLFDGENISLTLAGVLRGPIDLDKLARETPAVIRNLLRRCLDRDVRNRLRDIGEARIVIDAALAGEMAPDQGAPVQGIARRQWLAWSVAAVLATGLSPVAYLYFHEKSLAPAEPVRLQMPVPENAGSPALSPDGRKVAFSAGDRLWIVSLESGERRDLTVADRGVPFWSPDSPFIGYLAGRKLQKIEASGGSPQTVADFPGRWGGGAWNQDDMIVFADLNVGLFRVLASGGVPVQITALDPTRQENRHFGASFLPDGRHFLYIRTSNVLSHSAIYVGSTEAQPEQQSSKPVIASGWQPMFVASGDLGVGHLLFVREGTLMAQMFDHRRLELKGQATPAAEQFNSGGSGWAPFSASANNVLVFRRGAASDRQLTWFNREFKVLGTAGELGDYQTVALSPDGGRLAVTKASGAGAPNIWLLDLARGTSTRFTFGSAQDSNPVWSQDGSRIIFSSNRDGPFDLYQKPADGGRDEEVLLKSGEDKFPTSWSRDGSLLLYIVAPPRVKSDVWVLPLKGNKKPIPFLTSEFAETQARFSPDGHWVVYTSNESGRFEVYVRSFSMNSARTVAEAGGKWQISNGGGEQPRWRGDGREIYYRSDGGKLMAVEITTSPTFRVGKPQPLGDRPFTGGWESAADGKRFLSAVPKSGQESYAVVLNWQAGLKK